MPSNSNSSIVYKDRDSASRELIETIPRNLFEPENSIAIGVSEGGVYFAEKIAKAFNIDMNILLTEPIVAPNNSELSIAIVSETEDMVMNKALIDSFEIDEDYVYNEAKRKYDEAILSYVYRYRKGIPLRSMEGKNVILVDESIESGLTMSVALKTMIEMEAKSIYIAAPVLDQVLYDNLLSLCDGVFCPHRIRDYISIEYYYEILEKIDFETLKRIIDENGVTDTNKHINKGKKVNE